MRAKFGNTKLYVIPGTANRFRTEHDARFYCQEHGIDFAVVEKYDSRKEWDRWNALQLLEREGIISDLRRQVEFTLADQPGSVTEILRLINDFQLNISYISSQENGSDFQAFKMGLFVGDETKLNEFLKKAQALCPVRLLDYNHSEKILDNSIFL